jgi:hypothetical protein
VTTAHNVLRDLRALGAHIECADGRLVMRAGDRPIPKRLVEEARSAKRELLAMLDGSPPPKLLHQYSGGGLSVGTPENPSISAALAKTAKPDFPMAVLGNSDGGLSGNGGLSGDDGGLRGQITKTATRKSTLAVLAKPQHSCGSGAPLETKTATTTECIGRSPLQAAKIAPCSGATVGSPDRCGERLAADPTRCGGCGEPVLGDDRFYEYEGGYRCHTDPACLIAWNEKWHAAEGREYDGEFYRQNLIPDGVMESSPKRPAHAGAPAAQWTEGFAHLDPDRPLLDLPLNRWRQLLTDVRRLMEGGTVARAAELGWTVYDLFGCDGEEPGARLDQMGLVWFIKGGRIISVSMSAAVVETPTGARQTYRRKDGAPGRVLVWELFNEGRA